MKMVTPHVETRSAYDSFRPLYSTKYKAYVCLCLHGLFTCPLQSLTKSDNAWRPGRRGQRYKRHLSPRWATEGITLPRRLSTSIPNFLPLLNSKIQNVAKSNVTAWRRPPLRLSSSVSSATSALYQFTKWVGLAFFNKYKVIRSRASPNVGLGNFINYERL